VAQPNAEVNFASSEQIPWRFELILFDPESQTTLFLSQTNARGSTTPTHFTKSDGVRLILNEHLGNLLRDYLRLLTEAMRLHNLKITNSMSPLSTMQQGDSAVQIQARIRGHLNNSHTLQSQMGTFKETWKTNRALNPPPGTMGGRSHSGQ
jgi:hypothetical protein